MSGNATKTTNVNMKNQITRFIHAHCNSIAEKHRKGSPCNHKEQRERLRKVSPQARTPKAPKNGYALQNGEEMHRLHPATFDLHSQEDRNNVEVGQYVKVYLSGPTPSSPGERFWVWVVSKQATGKGFTFIGQVYSDLWHTAEHGISAGDMLQFGPEHILVIEL